jgi:hypothetical protein
MIHITVYTKLRKILLAAKFQINFVMFCEFGNFLDEIDDLPKLTLTNVSANAIPSSGASLLTTHQTCAAHKKIPAC